MHKRGAGVAFCITAAFLFAAYYLSAAIYLSASSGWSNTLFANGLSFVGVGLPIAAAVFLLAGIVYIVIAELEHKKSNK